MKEVIITSGAQKPGGMPYSQAIKVGNIVYVAGQGPFEPETGMSVGNTLEIQARRALDNLKAILEASGAKLSDVVKVTVFWVKVQSSTPSMKYIKNIFHNHTQQER